MENNEQYYMYEKHFEKIDRAYRRAIDANAYRLPNPITDWFIGMVQTNRIYVMKEDLEIGECYYGKCRNASIAIWDGKVFTYMRTKFGSTFPETINHFEDDDGFDLFAPYFKLDEKDLEIPHINDIINTLKK